MVDLLPSFMVLNYQQGHDRIVAMNSLYEKIKDKPFTYYEEFYNLHGSHRGRKLGCEFPDD